MNASAWTLTAIGVPLAAFSLFWLLRQGLHAALLRGLRAPRLVIEFLRRCPPTPAPAAPAPPETALKIPTPAPTAPPQKAAR